METIRVNMTPCEDVKTIHASQNDNEARQWGFELHNNGEKIDSSSISDQMVFKVYEGGTEEILPTNGSTPTTSPFKGNIKYPQGLLSDQEFLYRESPTEEDGLAKITDIKGQTLKWNQLNQSSRTTGTAYGLTYSCTDDLWSFQGTYTGGNGSAFRCGNSFVSIPAGHKVLLLNTSPWKVRLQGNETLTNENTPQNRIIETRSGALADIVVHAYGLTSGDTVNVQCHFGIIDLTVMFGETKANEIYAMETAQIGSGVAYFKSLFPLDYYSYNSGSLIPFMGNGIKTVGFNQWDEEWEAGALSVTDGSTINVNSYLRSKNFIPVISGKTYCRGISYQSDCRVFYYDANHSYIGNVATSSSNTLFTIPSGVSFIKFHKNGANYDNNICINISDTSKNGTYEPYTSSTLSLPISTYFPAGMKRVGNAYDELTPAKATPRIGSITLNGSEAWIKSTSYQGNYYVLGLLSDVKYPDPNAISNSLILVYNTTQLSESDLCFMFDGTASSQNVNIKNTSMTTLDQFKAWLQSNPVTIYYELATYEETSFTTASLVTENGEIPLSNEDGILVGKCIEQLSSESGFFDAKIKLADSDGECYSNKIQLHVERKPS